MAWRPDGNRLATAGQDGKVRLWDAATGQEVAAADGGAAWVDHLAWAPKGDYLASGAGKKLRLWDADGNLAKAYSDSLSTIAAVVWSPRGKEFVAGGYGGVTFFRPDADRPVNQFAWKGSILALAWSPDGKMLAGGGQDATVHFWYVKSGEDLQMAGYPSKVRELGLGFDEPLPGDRRRGSADRLGLQWRRAGRLDAADVRIAPAAADRGELSASRAAVGVGGSRWEDRPLVSGRVEESPGRGGVRRGRVAAGVVARRRPARSGWRERSGWTLHGWLAPATATTCHGTALGRFKSISSDTFA